MNSASIARATCHRRTRKGIPLRLAAHDVTNCAAAEVIVGEPEHFGGQDSGLCRWARRVLARIAEEAAARSNDPQHELFRGGQL